MSRNEIDAILKAVDEMCEAHKQGIKGILLSVDANATVTGKELKVIKEHLEEQSVSIKKLWDDNEKGKEVVKDYKKHKEKDHPASKFVVWIKEKWYWALLIFFVVELILEIIFNIFGVRKLAEIIWGKI